jgi:hypothetical protein
MQKAGKSLAMPDLPSTGRWLSRKKRPEVANQMAAAAVSLLDLALLTGQDEFLAAADKKIDALLRGQDGEGFFPEYGGADTGYLSLTLSCLKIFLARRPQESLQAALGRGGRFLEERLDRYGRSDPLQNSRRTGYHYPCGLAAFAPAALGRHWQGVSQGKAAHPGWLDDRYCIGLVTDYLRLAWELEFAADNC